MLTKLATAESRKQHFATIQYDQPYLYILPFSVSNKTPPSAKSHGINYYGCQPRGQNKEPGWDPTLSVMHILVRVLVI